MSKKVAAFGEVVMRLEIPGYEKLSQSHTLKHSFSGTGVNVASFLSQMGHQGYLVSALPDNAIGEAALAYLRKLGINTKYIDTFGHYIRMYFLEHGFGGRKSRVTNTSRVNTSFSLNKKTRQVFSEIAKQLDVVHFCGISLASNESIRNQMKEFAREVTHAKGKVVFDCNYRPGLWGENGYDRAREYYEEMLNLADIVMMNEKDALYLLGMSSNQVNRKAQLEELIPLVAEKYDISTIAGTHRSILNNQDQSIQGFLYKENHFSFSRKHTFTALDRIGTGDAYTTGVLHGEIEQYIPMETVEFATNACVLAHTIPGDTPILNLREIEQYHQEDGDIFR